MYIKRTNNKKNSLKDLLLRSFLIISIIFTVFLVSNCDQLFDIFGPGPGSHNPDFSNLTAAGFATTIFTEVAKGAGGQIGKTSASWALSAIGLSDESSDYNAQLDKIRENLQLISSQLKGIRQELDKIYNQLQIINCTQWSLELLNEATLVDDYMKDYQNMMTTISTGGNVSNAVISDWVDQVLATGKYTSNTSMGKVLTKFSITLIGPANTGLLPACIQSISYVPPDNSFGTDTVYYNTVKLFTEYYFDYQVRALFLYTEAKHYQAWMAAGSPNSDYLSADSVAGVCSNADAKLYCNSAAGQTNILYNSLINQFRIGGAPYSDNHFVLMYRQVNSLLFPLSLEDFTVAAGDNCKSPLTSASPCGITAGFFDTPSMQGVTYRGYTGWITTRTGLMTYWLSGWKSGTAGNYLQNKLGFKNMKNKIIISSIIKIIRLNESGSNQEVIPFIDTDFDYNWFSNVPGEPVQDEFQYQAGLMTKSRRKSGFCQTSLGKYYIKINYNTNSNVPSNRNGFYNAVGYAEFCEFDGKYATPFAFSTIPGWIATQDGKLNHENSARQYRWPVVGVNTFTCTRNYSDRNAGGVWTMCGDDFTAFLDSYVPRPETCDYPGTDIECNLTSQDVANAHMEFGNNTKSSRSF